MFDCVSEILRRLFLLMMDQKKFYLRWRRKLYGSYTLNTSLIVIYDTNDNTSISKILKCIEQVSRMLESLQSCHIYRKYRNEQNKHVGT